MLVKTVFSVPPAARTFAYPAPQTLLDALRDHAVLTPQAPAIIFDDLTELSYRTLYDQILRAGQVLKDAGISARNRVAVIMADGPALALAVTAVACHATVIPLNPQLTLAEIDDLFVTLELDAVVLAQGADTPVRTLLRQRGTCLLEAATQTNGIELALSAEPLGLPWGEVAPDDAAMILRTSGTTARAKLVPVTHRNLQSMAARRQHWFGIGSKDRAICVMPLYYAQGLCNALFVQLLLGASVAFPRRQSGNDFCAWLAKFGPTWYSAGPTFHRSVLEQAQAIPREQRRHALRFIQSGAAPLPPAVHDGLESVFGVPVVDTYGLSEAGNISANSVVGAGRKRGTVGIAWPDEVAIRHEDGSIIESGGPGEIVLRGPGLTPGYLGDAEANRDVFVDGWFRTGDLGQIDAEGFLTVIGRFKELINRGGEKISPAEIDDALQRHPAVIEAAAFPVPHPRLGEDVAAAVILRAGTRTTPLELRQFLQASLVPFKIPRRIHIVSSLPKGETGKVLRKELSRRFATPDARAETTWASTLEAEIARIWHRLLNRDGIGPDDDFFEIGGDSLLAVEMLAAVERLTGRAVPSSALFEAATIRKLGQILEQEEALQHQPLLQLSSGSRTALFFFHGAFNTGGGYTKKLARLVGADQPFYVVSPNGLDGAAIPSSIEAMAADRLRLIRTAQPHGPYRLGGYCLSALIAFETARMLIAAGETVEFVAMIDPPTTNARPSVQALLGAMARARSVLDGAVDDAMRQTWFRLTQADKASRLTARQLWQTWLSMRRLWWNWLKGAAKRAVIPAHGQASDADRAGAAKRSALTRSDQYTLAMSNYRPASLAVRTIYFASEYNAAPWRRIAPELEVIKLSGDHSAVVFDPTEVAEHLRVILSRTR